MVDSITPTWDEALANASPVAQQKSNDLPTWDEASKTQQPSALSATVGMFTPHFSAGASSDAASDFFKNTAAGRVMSAFGHQAATSFTEDKNVGLSPETEDAFKKAGIFNDYTKGENNLSKAFTQALAEPAAAGLDMMMRAGTAAFTGAQAATEKAFTEAGMPQIGRDVAASPEAFFGSPHILPTPVASARANAVIAEGEHGYFGLAEPTPEQSAERHAAAQMAPEAQIQIPPEVPTPKEPPDIHEIARTIAPGTFAEYDELSVRRDTAARWIRELSDQRQQEAETNAPHNEEIASLQEKLEGANARKTKIYQEKIDALTKANEDWIADQVSKDTHDLQNVRNAYQKADYRMRDLASDVSSAYRRAQEFMPEEKVETPIVMPPAETIAPELKPADVVEAKPVAAELRAPIVNDVSQKLIAAGRPKEEADAAAQLVAAHYQARSERFGGKLGTAEEMYHRDAPEIHLGKESIPKEKAQKLAQEKRGSITLAYRNAKATITLMRSANASTFIHEVGHHWLDELVRDAIHEEAPEGLKKDADTVRNWLGEKTGKFSGFTKTQHEKFARGFERYMMEGTAPSRELAGIFEKFKRWLTSIYQTVEKLRSPITDDIRDVFNRLLSSAPEKAVIAPERETANIHEKLAEITPPEKAEGVADTIHEAVERLANKEDKEIANGLDTKNAEGTEQIAQPATNAEAGIIPGQTTNPEQPKPINTSGSQPATEGAGLATESNKGSGDEQRTNPNAITRKPKSDLVDKAGNIRLDNLNTPDDINEIIRETAEDHGGFMEDRGIVTDAQVLDFADAMGVKAAEINLKQLAETLGRGQLASKIMAARKLLIQSAESVRGLMAKAAVGTDEDVMSYAEGKARHIMIQKHLSSLTAEAGRALRAFHEIGGLGEAKSLGEFLEQATGRTLNQLKAEAKLGSALDSGGKISKFIHDSQKPSFGEMILEYWTNGLISGPATHTTYMIGNTLLSLWKAIPETGTAALIGKLHGGPIKAGEVGAQLKAGAKNIPTALSAAGKALKSGVTTLLPGEDVTKMPFQPGAELATPGVIGNEAISWRQLGSDIFGTAKGMRDAFIATGELIKAGGEEDAATIGLKRSPLGTIPDITVKGVQIPVGNVLRTPARAIAAIHSFFRTMNYSMDKAAIAYRTAANEGLAGDQFAARVGDIVSNPTEEIMKEARGIATNLTLMGQGGKFTQAVSRLTNAEANLPLLGRTKLLKFIDPFVRIGSNIIDQAILQRTPVGLLSSEIRADLSGANGPVARDFAQARMLVGTALAITTGGLAAEGLISGSGPSDPKEAALWRLNGNQAHSVRVGDSWYDIHRLGPLGMLMGIAADMHDVAHAATKEDLSKVGAMLTHAITQNILDESFMRGPADIIKAVTDSDRYGEAWVRNFAASFVPFSVGMSQVARAIDPYSRQTRTVMDAIRAKIPYESEALLPRRDVWGEPIANRSVLGPAGFSAIYESKIKDDPVNQAAMKLGYYPGQPARKIRGIELTDQQYDDYCRLAGRMAKLRLNAIVSQSGFANIPPGIQVDIMKKTVDKSREVARSLVMMQNPAIIQKAVDNKRQATQGIKH